MFVPDAMKLNKFRLVNIPRPREMFARYGFKPMSVFSGDSVVPQGVRKIDTMNMLEELDNRAWLNEVNATLDGYDSAASASSTNETAE